MDDSDTEQSDAARSDDGEPNLALMLQSGRDALGVTIEEIATELRIEARLLRALEDGRFDELGAPVFAKGYLKQYGQRLGLRYDDLLAEYYRMVDRTEIEIAPSHAIKLRDERQITIWVIAALAIALLAVFLLVWWLDDPADDLPVPVTQPSVDAGTVELPPPPAAAAGVTQDEPVRVAADVSRQTGTSREPTAASRASQQAPPAASAELGSAASGSNGLGFAPTSPTSPEPTATTRAAASAEALPAGDRATDAGIAGGTEIEIEFDEDCWTEITDANGERLYYGLAEAGARVRLAGAAPIRFFLGNADSVTLSVDGQSYPVPATSRRGDLAQFTVVSATD